ncbi:MAG: hypothetical protein V7L01_13835 [Nostoc sp.]|uniref:hypothetical protein n=1 Tax=Nostoc sp. TaxID=1180 RepID=UPI002FFC4C40
MHKLERVRVALRESERRFRVIFNHIFEFIGLKEPISIFMEGNQAALKFAGITTSKAIRCPLWEAYWSDFSRHVEDFSFRRREGLNFRPNLVGKLAQGLGLLLVFLHNNVKSQARWWTISKEIQAQLQRVISRAFTIWTHGLHFKPFSNQSRQVIFLMPESLEGLGILPKNSS